MLLEIKELLTKYQTKIYGVEKTIESFESTQHDIKVRYRDSGKLFIKDDAYMALSDQINILNSINAIYIKMKDDIVALDIKSCPLYTDYELSCEALKARNKELERS